MYPANRNLAACAIFACMRRNGPAVKFACASLVFMFRRLRGCIQETAWRFIVPNEIPSTQEPGTR